MEKVARKFRSFAVADKADREFHLSVILEQRLDILGELIKQKWGTRLTKILLHSLHWKKVEDLRIPLGIDIPNG